MSQLRVDSLGISADGYSTGKNQSLEHPFGPGGHAIMDWYMYTRAWKEMVGSGPAEEGVDNQLVVRGLEGVGAYIMGRNMFGPIRGEWPDNEWKGWWGDDPPYHTPVFVLTHHARAPIQMLGGTEFRFVTGGIHDALMQAKAAAGTKDIRIGGGVATVRQYLQAKLVDQLHLVQTPVLLGAGESIYEGTDLKALGYECVERIPGERATHLFIRRK